MGDRIRLRPAPGDIERETIERGYYCRRHKVVKVVDKLGRAVCPVCLVAEVFDEGPI